MSRSAFHPEDKARSLIDKRLVACGWVIQSKTEMNLGAGLGVTVREFQTTSGPVDYGLFVGRKLCGVIEAKPEGTTLSGYSEQAARYIADVPKHLVREEGQVRFEYVASGTETLFRDHADPDPVSRRVFTFHRPETLERQLKEPLTLRGRLQPMAVFVTDGLRTCQIDAVSALEGSMRQNRPRALVQMATGAGKTFTACTLSYRLLAHAGFRRILFLADRANLVRQTRDEFLAYRPPGTGRSFSEIYNVQKLGAAGLDKEAQVVIATIQRVYSVLTGKELSEEEEEASSFEQPSAGTERLVSYNPSIPIESFDLVITDECHRSIYGTWRQVLEYFDAFTVGLTATPSLHTLGFFGKNLVAQYPYERSVVDGVNVGFDIFRIRTEIGERGGTVKAGYDLPVRDKRTRAERYETLDADFSYTPDQIDRSVLVPNQIRTILETYRDSLFTELFPGRTEVPKTLIFAKDDHHAEEITQMVREVFGKGNDFAKKITYKTDGGDPEALIRSFRNDYNSSKLPRIDLFEVLKRWFITDSEFSAVWRIQAKNDFDFRTGEQWSDTDKALLNAQQRPHIVFNRVLTILKAVAGMEINGRHEIQYLPSNNAVTAPNELLSAASKWMAAGCDAEDEESEAFDNCATCGMGWTENRLSYEDDSAGLYIEESVNPLEMYWDHSVRKKNLDGAGRLARAKEIPLRDAMQLFPGKTRVQLDAVWAVGGELDKTVRSIEEKRIRNTDSGSAYDHYDDATKVMVVEMQWFEREAFYVIADEETQTKVQISEAAYQHMLANARKLEERLGHGIKTMPTAARMTRKLYKRAFLGGELLQSGDAPVKGRFSWACITGELDRNKGHWFGLIKTMTFWATESMNRTATMQQNQRKHSAVMAQIHRERRDNKRASAWLAKHSLKAKPKPKPKPLPLERWQTRSRAQKQERRALAKPLLKGVE